MYKLTERAVPEQKEKEMYEFKKDKKKKKKLRGKNAK